MSGVEPRITKNSDPEITPPPWRNLRAPSRTLRTFAPFAPFASKAFAFALVFLVVIPEGDLRLPLTP
jgi:hypothetical protein